MKTKNIFLILFFVLISVCSSCNKYNSSKHIHSMLYKTGLYPVYLPIINNSDTIWCLVQSGDVIIETFSEEDLNNIVEYNKDITLTNDFAEEILNYKVIPDNEIEQFYNLHGIDKTIETYDINNLKLEQIIYIGLICWWNNIYIYYGCEDAKWHYIY